jgi:hypothetical protein
VNGFMAWSLEEGGLGEAGRKILRSAQKCYVYHLEPY